MDKLFRLSERNTNIKTEVTAGVTTFLAMVYILAVNPAILSSTGMSGGAVFTATAVSAAIGTLCMAFFANYPIALASGMGLNAYFAYSVCVPLAREGVADPWKIALTAVFCEGIIFILLSFTNFREKLVNEIPVNLKLGITAGIGLFITIVGLKSACIAISSESTLVEMGHVGTPQFALAMAGLIIIAVLHRLNVKGYILYGILATWVLGMGAQLIGWYVVDEAAGNASLYPGLAGRDILPAAPYFFAFDFKWALNNLAKFGAILFSFFFADVFDTVGTLIGVSAKGKLLDKDGKLPKVKGALLADAVGTTAGACLGTSTVSCYVESSAGVAVGGRTGLTSLVTAILFLLALFLSPLFLAIPGFATAPAMMWVGFLLMVSIKEMDFTTDVADALGGFLTIIMMPFTYSIANGIMFGILAWVILRICTGKIKTVPPIMWISFVLFVIRIITMIVENI